MIAAGWSLAGGFHDQFAAYNQSTLALHSAPNDGVHVETVVPPVGATRKALIDATLVGFATSAKILSGCIKDLNICLKSLLDLVTNLRSD